MLHFIYNPTAGSGRAEAVASRVGTLLESRGVPFVMHPTGGRGDGATVARALSGEGAEDIVVMGGDGTLNEVLNGLTDPARPRLGLIPCGSGNDFAAAAGIPRDPAAALALILDGEAKPTDYMECAGVRGINAIGTGIDVDILRRYARMKRLKGSAAYFAALVISLIRYRPYVFEEADGDGVRPHRAFIACAGNGVSIGGGIPICPRARIDDGLLEVVIVDDIKKPAIPFALFRLMRRRVLELKTTRYRRQSALRVRADVPMPIQIDGEIYENLPFDVRIVPGGLKMYRP